MSDGLAIVYLTALLAVVLIMSRRNSLARRSTAWKMGAAALWALIFVGLLVLASALGWRLP